MGQPDADRCGCGWGWSMLMSDPNAIDLQTWEDVQRAIEIALSIDGAKVEVNSDLDHGVALDVVLPSGRNVHVQITDRPKQPWRRGDEEET